MVIDKKCLKDVDIAVVGAGVVGCAVAREMTLAGASVVLLEKGEDILGGASKGNSAILHTGFDAPVGTLEWECVQNGYDEYLKIHKDLGLPLRKTGALVAAWNQEQEDSFTAIIEKAQANGVTDLQVLSKDAVLKREPHLSSHIRAAISVPREFIIDPWSAPLAYISQSIENGGDLMCSAEVIGGDFDGTSWVLHTTQGKVRARYVINTAGLYGDLLDQKVLGSSEFEIKPRKGQFVVFDKAASKFVSSIILPVPTKRTKGIVLFPTIFGNVAVGPTAEDQESRDDASVHEETLKDLREQAISHLPALKDIPVTTTYAGIRPASDATEYRVIEKSKSNWITLGGIRSTGLTSALGLAKHVRRLLAQQGVTYNPLVKPRISKVPNLSEYDKRDYQKPDYGQIVCHCEMVTRREIDAALNSVAPAKNLAGLKRRTRAGMGRCQGFGCSASVAEITKNKFKKSLQVGDIK